MSEDLENIKILQQQNTVKNFREYDPETDTGFLDEGDFDVLESLEDEFKGERANPATFVQGKSPNDPHIPRHKLIRLAAVYGNKEAQEALFRDLSQLEILGQTVDKVAFMYQVSTSTVRRWYRYLHANLSKSAGQVDVNLTVAQSLQVLDMKRAQLARRFMDVAAQGDLVSLAAMCKLSQMIDNNEARRFEFLDKAGVFKKRPFVSHQEETATSVLAHSLGPENINRLLEGSPFTFQNELDHYDAMEELTSEQIVEAVAEPKKKNRKKAV